MLTKIAQEVDPRSGRPLADTRFVRNITADDKIRSLQNKASKEPYAFSSAVSHLAEKIKESAIYKRFVKSLEDNVIDENVWKDIFELIIMADPSVNKEITTRENYTLKGVDRMRELMDITFSNFFASADNLQDALKILERSMSKAREFYFRLLALPIAITTLREREIDNAQYKFLKTSEDINPNLRFVENEFVAFLRNDEEVQKGIKEFKIDWLAEDEGLIRTLLKVVTQSNIYKEYLEFPATDFKNDCNLWRNLFKYILFIDDNFIESLEDRSVFWNDDLDVLGTFILKSIKRLSDKEDSAINETGFVLPMFKDKEDAEFGAELFSEVIRRKDYYRDLVLSNIDNSQWEMERLAFMDSVIIMTALAEIIKFPKIPLTVSFNEYIEIAKYYSTPKSGVFINGLLGKIVASLQEQKITLKTFNNDKKR